MVFASYDLVPHCGRLGDTTDGPEHFSELETFVTVVSKQQPFQNEPSRLYKAVPERPSKFVIQLLLEPTSRDQPKSAPYLRLKNRTSKCQSIGELGTL